MVMPREKLFALLAEIRSGLEKIYGERLVSVYLYGSYARGEADEDSDIDVAIVLIGAVNQWSERDRVSPLLGDLSLRENCLLASIFVSEDDWHRRRFAIHRSIHREGIAV